MSNEVQTFLNVWDDEAQKTVAMLHALPEGQYDFRPDPGGRSLGELAWHLAEIDGYSGFGIERGKFEVGVKPEGLERPKTIAALAPGYERAHADARARIAKLIPADLDREVIFFTGEPMSIRNILWSALLHHEIHHRGQIYLYLAMLGVPTSPLYGLTSEEVRARSAD